MGLCLVRIVDLVTVTSVLSLHVLKSTSVFYVLHVLLPLTKEK